MDIIPSLFPDLILSEIETKRIWELALLQLKKWTFSTNLKSFFILATWCTTWRDLIYTGSLTDPDIVWDEHEIISPTHWPKWKEKENLTDQAN